MFAPGTRVRVTETSPGHDAEPGRYEVESYVPAPPIWIEGEDQGPFYFLLNGDGFAYSAPEEKVVLDLRVIHRG